MYICWAHKIENVNAATQTVVCTLALNVSTMMH